MNPLFLIRPFGVIRKGYLRMAQKILMSLFGDRVTVRIGKEFHPSVQRGVRGLLNPEGYWKIEGDEKKGLYADLVQDPKNQKARRIFGITEDLLFIENEHTHGASSPGYSAVLISMDEPYDLGLAPPQYKMWFTALIAHELGHSFGLGHCKRINCMMSVTNPFQGATSFCPSCQEKVSQGIQILSQGREMTFTSDELQQIYATCS